MPVPQNLLDALAAVQARADDYAAAQANVATAQQTAQAVADQARQHLAAAEADFEAIFQSTYAPPAPAVVKPASGS